MPWDEFILLGSLINLAIEREKENMPDEKIVYLIDTDHPGARVGVKLDEGAAIPLADALAIKAAAETRYGAAFQWVTDDIVAFLVRRCPSLFAEYFANQT